MLSAQRSSVQNEKEKKEKVKALLFLDVTDGFAVWKENHFSQWIPIRKYGLHWPHRPFSDINYSRCPFFFLRLIQFSVAMSILTHDFPLHRFRIFLPALYIRSYNGYSCSGLIYK